MLTLLALRDSDRIRELKLTAKWSMDNAEKKKAISELLQYGDEGISVIREVLTVTAYDDVKQACVEAIRSIGKYRKSSYDSSTPDNTAVALKPRRKTNTAKKNKNQKNKRKRAKK